MNNEQALILSRARSTIWLLVLAMLLVNAKGATYYVDYSSGNDINSGVSKTSAWKHCPGMQPFRGNYSPAAGDKFIFKGGVTWPNAALPLLVTSGGAEGNHNYYGVDLTWHSGTEFSRPVFDGQSMPFTNHSGLRDNVVWIRETSFVTLASIEMRNWVFTDPVPTSFSDGFCVFISRSSNVDITDLYAHDWVVRSRVDSKFGGLGASESSAITAKKCKVVAPTNVAPTYVTDTGGGRTSGCGIIGFETIEDCEFVGTSQGIWGGTLVKGNIVRDGQDSFDAESHENGVWIQNDARFYNNKIYNVKEGVGAFFLPGWGYRSGCRMYIYNNIFHNLPQVNLSGDQNPDAGNEVWFFNNLVQRPSSCLSVGSSKGGEPFRKLIVQNNIFISDAKYSNPSNIVTVLNLGSLGTQYSNSSNMVFTSSEATGLDLQPTNSFMPKRATSALADKGIDFGTITRIDAVGNSRPRGRAWDVGPYEAVAPPTGLLVK